MPFQLRARYHAELVQLATNFATGSRRRGVASIDKGLRPEALRQIPDVGVRAARATRQVHFADQEAALQFHQCAFGCQLLRSFAESGTTPQFPRRLRTADITQVDGGLPLGDVEEFVITVGASNLAPPPHKPWS